MSSAEPDAPSGDPEPGAKLTWWQRQALKELRRNAGKSGGEPLDSGDWKAVWQLHAARSNQVMKRVMLKLPSSPRCAVCGAPFAGAGRVLVRPLGYRPSRKNPTICDVCVEASPPGGTTMYAGILFADLRGFTARTEGTDPAETSALLRRFYRCAEDVLFPEALIDKLIGDEVMALYLAQLGHFERDEMPAVMLGHARDLLEAVGYGSGKAPFLEMGVGLDIGEAFVGNIGQRALYDFTAVGDVVNTASRLQGEAASGEVVLSERVAAGLPEAERGAPVELTLKGKAEPQAAYRVRIAA
jgi:adenylate cyclase